MQPRLHHFPVIDYGTSGSGGVIATRRDANALARAHGGQMTPRDDEKGNFDDTEFPPDSENTKDQTTRQERADGSREKGATAGDEGDYDDKDQ
jgi:hypothetical protein